MQAVVLLLDVVDGDVGRDVGAGEDDTEVEGAGFGMARDVHEFQEIRAADHFGDGAEAELGHDFAKFLRDHGHADKDTFTVETRGGTLTEDPAVALELCQRVPGLGLSFDPSHYLTGPYRNHNLDPLYPYVRHVRLRDSGTKPDQFQVRIGQGEIEYGRIINQLERQNYGRLLTVAIRDVPDAPFAMEIEVRKLKFLLESLV